MALLHSLHDRTANKQIKKVWCGCFFVIFFFSSTLYLFCFCSFCLFPIFFSRASVVFAHSKHWVFWRQSSHFLFIIYSYTSPCRDRESPWFRDKSFLLPLAHPAVVSTVAQLKFLVLVKLLVYFTFSLKFSVCSLKESTRLSLLVPPEPQISCGSSFCRW